MVFTSQFGFMHSLFCKYQSHDTHCFGVMRDGFKQYMHHPFSYLWSHAVSIFRILMALRLIVRSSEDSSEPRVSRVRS